MKWLLFLYPKCMFPLYTRISKLKQWVTLLSVHVAFCSSSVDYPFRYYLWPLFSFDVIGPNACYCPTATLSCSEYIVSSIGSTVTYFLPVLYSYAPFQTTLIEDCTIWGILARIRKRMTSSTNSFSLIHSWLP